MRIGVLGTGAVGTTIAGRLVEVGHDVRLGARAANNETATAWATNAGDKGSNGTFADAAAFGDVVVNATSGLHSMEALEAAGAENLRNKILVDIANPITMEDGRMVLGIANTDSLAERIQRTFPDTRVIKTLNTVNSSVMVQPGRVEGDHVVFTCGNDDDAKQTVKQLLAQFGWTPSRVIDLGDITAARATEAYLLLWVRMMQVQGTSTFNIAVMPERAS